VSGPVSQQYQCMGNWRLQCHLAYPLDVQVGLIIYWIAVTAMLYSAGDLTTNCRTPIDFKPYTFEVGACGYGLQTDRLPLALPPEPDMVVLCLQNFSNFSSTPTYTSNTTSDCYANLTRCV
jgi:choline transporter-like protein 2/4/5